MSTKGPPIKKPAPVINGQTIKLMKLFSVGNYTANKILINFPATSGHGKVMVTLMRVFLLSFKAPVN